jgi:2-dehydropantoate 2-reductase
MFGVGPGRGSRRLMGRMDVAVVGAGAIGVLLAAELQAAGREVTVCARRRFERLVVEGRHDLPARVVTEPSGTAEWILVALKAQDSSAAAPWIAQLGGQVVAVQNGIEHRENLGDDALPAIITAATERVGEGRVRHRFGHRLQVPDEPVSARLATLFDGTIMDVELVGDFHTEAWRKLLRNATANPITALTRARMGIFKDEPISQLAHGVLTECVAVGRADGARFADDEAEQILAAFEAMPDDSGTSMLYDRLAERPLEYEALSGAVVRAADRHGIAVPLNRALLALLSVAR